MGDSKNRQNQILCFDSLFKIPIANVKCVKRVAISKTVACKWEVEFKLGLISIEDDLQKMKQLHCGTHFAQYIRSKFFS